MKNPLTHKQSGAFASLEIVPLGRAQDKQTGIELLFNLLPSPSMPLTIFSEQPAHPAVQIVGNFRKTLQRGEGAIQYALRRFTLRHR